MRALRRRNKLPITDSELKRMAAVGMAGASDAVISAVFGCSVWCSCARPRRAHPPISSAGYGNHGFRFHALFYSSSIGNYHTPGSGHHCRHASLNPGIQYQPAERDDEIGRGRHGPAHPAVSWKQDADRPALAWPS